MPNPDIARRRMINQQISVSTIHSPAEIVRWLGAVQSQDYYGAKWAVGLRAGVDNAAVEQAVNAGSILRLHVLRPTWHFVAAEDVRWMLSLTAARVKAGMAARMRELQIDDAVLARSQEIFRQALSGGKQLTRDEMGATLNQGGVSTDLPQRLVHLLMHAELDQVLVNGAWKGKQATYALLDERAPAGSTPLFERVPAAAELARRFFTSHGPASLKDFTWWSGLTVAEARAGIELARSSLACEEIDGTVYWGPDEGPNVPAGPAPGPVAHLLPNYDEYVVAYTGRGAIFDPALSHKLHLRGGVLNNVLVIDGLVAGGWKREFKKGEVLVTIELIRQLSVAELQAVEEAARLYGEFMGLNARHKVINP